MINTAVFGTAVIALYLVGSVLFVPGSILLYWNSIEWSTGIFIFGCVLFLIGGALDIVIRPKDCDARFYLAGGIAFTAGSILFWPSFPATVTRCGIWVFRCGSACYISGSIRILINAIILNAVTIATVGTCFYMTGSTLFIIGGIISEYGGPRVAFATVWVIGSVSFTIGAILQTIGYFNQRLDQRLDQR
jgi:hypothetical protein